MNPVCSGVTEILLNREPRQRKVEKLIKNTLVAKKINKYK